ncbi:hypothetical protein [Blastococcus sp. TF02A-26]|uniref:hypothetical protein n=1 Tax=Blastococcus sp. TF02A-26 TaxID=2250577 RepID=UPI000DE9D76E|nr:hypothetical protein [Blastococcus sp. TF02A-26]RBY86156.1 hypothetical protein DQ240_10165 [Blastococcus sp. TF02A-26]
MASTTPDVRADAAHPIPPVTVLAAAGIALLQAVAVVAAALTGLDGLFRSSGGSSGAVAALWLLGLAAWAVFGAGGGLLLVDGSGSRLLVVVACTELAVLVVAFLVALATPSLDALGPGLPVPALALSAVAVPVGKMLLATAPSATAWVAAGPRPRERAPELSEDQRTLRVATVAVIGVALLAVVLTNPADAGTGTPSPVSTSQH